MRCLILIVIFFVLVCGSQIERRHSRGIAAANIDNKLVFGLDRLLQILNASNDGFLLQLFQRYSSRTGKTLEHTIFGQRTIGTIEKQNLHTLLNVRSKDYGFKSRRQAFWPFLGNGIFTEDDAVTTRRILKRLLDGEKHAEVVAARCRNLLEAIYGCLKEAGSVVDLQPIFRRYTLDVMAEYLLGESTHSLQGADLIRGASVATALDQAQDYIAWRARTPKVFWAFKNQRYREACATVHLFVDETIDRSLERGEADNNRGWSCLSELLLKYTRDRCTLRSQLVSLLVAGSDTTASLLSSTFFLLVRHPNVLEDLRTEVALNSPRDAIPTLQTVQGMPILQSILKEVLRLYPPVPTNSRTALKATFLPRGGGLDGLSPVPVPKGTEVAYSSYAAQRLPEDYGMDAELFRPERWRMNSANVKSYFPFGGGSRSCLGKDQALFQAAFTVIRIVQKFPKIKLPEGAELKLIGAEAHNTGLFLLMKEGCNVEIELN